MPTGGSASGLITAHQGMTVANIGCQPEAAVPRDHTGMRARHGTRSGACRPTAAVAHSRAAGPAPVQSPAVGLHRDVEDPEPGLRFEAASVESRRTPLEYGEPVMFLIQFFLNWP